LGRSYGEDDVNAFFNALDVNHDGTLTYDEFRQAFFTVTV
jgi:Ca2+-binding EF-hand superfamily protein